MERVTYTMDRSRGSGCPVRLPLPAAVARFHRRRAHHHGSRHRRHAHHVLPDARGVVASSALPGTRPHRHHPGGCPQRAQHRGNARRSSRSERARQVVHAGFDARYRQRQPRIPRRDGPRGHGPRFRRISSAPGSPPRTRPRSECPTGRSPKSGHRSPDRRRSLATPLFRRPRRHRSRRAPRRRHHADRRRAPSRFPPLSASLHERCRADRHLASVHHDPDASVPRHSRRRAPPARRHPRPGECRVTNTCRAVRAGAPGFLLRHEGLAGIAFRPRRRR